MSKQIKQKQPPVTNFVFFGKENFKLMIIGVIILAIGFILMVGGKSPDPTKFNDDVIYSTTRITISPIIILTGFIIEIFAIMKQPKKSQ
jgi:hypothetical protein